MTDRSLPTHHSRAWSRFGLLVLVGLSLAYVGVAADLNEFEVMPAYDQEGQLQLPADFKQWTFVGSSLGLSYSDGEPGMEMFHHTLMEPSAHEHFARTGEFRDGTMLALLLHGLGEGVLPQRRGHFATELEGLEIAVKDSARFDGGWAYFGFGGRDGIRNTSGAFRSSACANCHVEHAAYDNVFLQFYPLLAETAPTDSPAQVALATFEDSDDEPSGPSLVARPEGTLAVRGLDPVLLTEGREEMGKPEIIALHNGFRYQFVSEPTRKRFVEDPARYGIQNESCPVVPGASASAELFSVHESRIYIFASEGCIDAFEANPEEFLSSETAEVETDSEA